MRHSFLLLLLLLVSLNIHSQATDFVTGLNQPQDLLVYEGELYVSERDANRIIKLDLSVPDPEPVVVLSVIQPWGLAIDGTELYYSQVQGQERISKIDLSDPNPVPTVVVENVLRAFDLEIYGNELYIAQFGLDRISKIDITIPDPPLVEVVGDIETAYALELVGDELYVIAWSDRKIYKIDLTNPNPPLIDVISNLSLPVGMKLRGNELYIAEAGQSIGSDRVSKIDINNPIRTTIVEGLYNPTQGLEIYNDVLYIAENFKISSFQLPPLAIDDFNLENISALPNPTFDFVEITGLTEQVKYKIYGISGTVLGSGIVSENKKISITQLAAGVYFLVLDNRKAIKIIKK